MTALHTWRVEAPSKRNSAASSQVPIPPMPEMGVFTAWAMVATAFKAIGFTAAPERPPCDEYPATPGLGTRVSRSTPIMAPTVLMAEIACAPAWIQAFATNPTSVTLGVILAMTGISTASTVQRLTFSANSTLWPMAEPIPISGMPCGQDIFSSMI